ncbi:uncharacterized protein BT62DRAFT_1009449 [Guyanagaster necrorhizus]|uniref:Uncharacterized protein n=1 Tax=Guyanagaster necrorhizus TaxID=856835 RepID=A0A9P7VNR0_9AGAR|nr:uncharacterized protein BT62DRAFT_1009449 [Guyanagaster necrorhizus MCA 3950]KAG7443261.1 hypothetical protein BT62DRAFT_1009449 [Guyanagaster necrorhizus MCA 3950]
MLPATTADLNHDFFELIASIIGTLLGLLAIITLCRGRQSVTAWIVRHYQAFQQVQRILRNVTPDLPFHDIPPSIRTSFFPQGRPLSETQNNDSDTRSLHEEEGSQDHHSAFTGFRNPWTTNVTQEPAEVSNYVTPAGSPEHPASPIPSGIGNRARDSLDATQMATRSCQSHNSPRTPPRPPPSPTPAPASPSVEWGSRTHTEGPSTLTTQTRRLPSPQPGTPIDISMWAASPRLGRPASEGGQPGDMPSPRSGM